MHICIFKKKDKPSQITRMCHTWPIMLIVRTFHVIISILLRLGQFREQLQISPGRRFEYILFKTCAIIGLCVPLEELL